MCSASKNSYLSRRTYSDTSAELVEARVGPTRFEHVQNCYGTRPPSRCYHDKMTLESLLNQFKSENSFLGRRRYPDK